MGIKSDQASAEEAKIAIGDKKYGRLVRMLREGYLSLCIYKNVHANRTFYDIVIYRKIKRNGTIPKGEAKFEYKRGANLKPSDISDLQLLLTEAEDYLVSCSSNNSST